MSRDYGEFGGALKTPGGEINGNFCDILEVCGKIYAVDSLSHLGLASTTIYSFDCDCKYHKIFSDENLGFKARYATGERAYILVSGSVSTRSGGEKLKSILLEISENGIDAKTEFDCGFYLVFNMIVKMCIRDSVGIVEKCENGVVYTVEGNSGDACRQKQYTVGSSSIYGYGVPAY